MPFFLLDVLCLSASVTNPCDRKKCEWLCLLSPSGPVCTCPNNYVADNGTCVERQSPTQAPFCKSADTAHQCTLTDMSAVEQQPYFQTPGWFSSGRLYIKMLHTKCWFMMELHAPIHPPTPSQLPPQGPAIFCVRTVAAASSTPAKWPSVAASPATPERDVRSTSVGTTARMEANAVLLIQVRAWHA